MSSERKAAGPGWVAAGLQYTGVGIAFMVEAGAVTALGGWLDHMWGTGPWLLVTGALTGVTLATAGMIRSIQALEKRSPASSTEDDAARSRDGEDQ